MKNAVNKGGALLLNKIRKIHLTPAQYITLGFLIIILLGGFVLYLPCSYTESSNPSIIDTIFTAASAVCVTGLVTLDTATTWTFFGQLWILCLIQIGGIGFVITTIFISFKKKVSLPSKIIARESLSQDSLGDIINVVKKVVIVTFIIELIGVFLLAIYFIPSYGFLEGLWYSIFHSISAFCNAGFDLMGSKSGEFSSLTSFTSNIYVNTVLCILIILGGLGFLTITEIIKKRSIKSLSLHSKIVIFTTIALIFIGAVAIFTLEYSNKETLGPLSLVDKITAATFQSVTIRTAGFNTIDLSLLRVPTIVVMVSLMIIGASPASTGGGIKTTTFFACVLFIKDTILGNEDHNAFERRIPLQTINKALATGILAILLSALLTIILSTLEKDISLTQAIFEVISALATVGLSLGITPLLSTISKLLLIITMFLGRVGYITVLIALSTKITQNKNNHKIKYTEENILI